MTPEQKARKVAEEIADRIGLQYVAVPSRQDDLRQLLREMLPTALLQFAQEQESEAVRELMDGLKVVSVAMKSDGRDVKFGEMTALEAAVKVAAALIAKHSKKGPNP